MDSSTSRTSAVQKRQAELKTQIAALQAQLAETPVDQTSISGPIKRKKSEPALLAPATPSPKKKRRIEAKGSEQPRPRISQPSFHQHQRATASLSGPSGKLPSHTAEQPDSVPSQFLKKLAKFSGQSGKSPTPSCTTRTSAFSDPVRPGGEAEDTSGSAQDLGLKRDDRLVLVEDLEPGPYAFTPPSDDPDFQLLEPHSGIRLSSRKLPHEDLQEHLRARYYLSPSRLYSVVRLLPDRQGYDVPVLGDWVTIAVVAERGPVKLSRAPVTLDPDEQTGKKPWQKSKGSNEEINKPTGKKYVNFKLIDFGARSRSSADGAQSVIRGDAFLTLLLFESDGFDVIQRQGGQKPQKVYKGGSRGAFEMMAKVKEGDVIVLLNPKILKPFQRSNDTPHPVNNVLALTPESAESIAVIGRSRDLGMCSVSKRDGKTCGSWCDKRVSDVCEYHLQNAVQHRRTGRAEFSAGTSGMSNTSVHKPKSSYDPARQWGLKPEGSSGGSTYVISGHVVSGSNADPRTMYVSETIGRESQAKAQRKSAVDADRVLNALLKRDRDGVRAVMLAREATGVSSGVKKGGKPEKLKSLEDNGARLGKSSYTAEVIKQLGFDPTLKAGSQRKVDDSVVREKLAALASVREARKEITLERRPGSKIRSGVVAPNSAKRAPLPYLPKMHQHTSMKIDADGQGDVEAKVIDLDDY